MGTSTKNKSLRIKRQAKNYASRRRKKADEMEKVVGDAESAGVKALLNSWLGAFGKAIDKIEKKKK